MILRDYPFIRSDLRSATWNKVLAVKTGLYIEGVAGVIRRYNHVNTNYPLLL